MNKITCGLTLFDPTEADIENVKYYSGIFAEILVYDNSKNKDNTHYFSEVGNIIFISNNNNNNDGLSIACHKLCIEAKQRKYDYIILFDQDSRMDSSSIKKLSAFLDKKFTNIAIYCPQIVTDKNEKKFKSEFEYVNWCITSGSLINLRKYGNIMTFDEAYFIDRLDKDLCEQVIRHNETILRVNSSYLFQQLGENRFVFGKNRSTHSSLRHYYINRNRFYFSRKFNKNKIITLLQLVNHVFQVIVYENKKIEKIKFIYKGFIDYKIGKYGEYKDSIYKKEIND